MRYLKVKVKSLVMSDSATYTTVILYNQQKVQTTQMPVDRGVGEQNGRSTSIEYYSALKRNESFSKKFFSALPKL